MIALMNDMTEAVNKGLWAIALYAALAVPDICGAIQSADGQATGARYRAWFDQYLAGEYPRLDAADCYQLRCSMLHQGTSATRTYPKVVFSARDESNNVIHNNNINDYLNIDIANFCNDLTDAFKIWVAEHEDEDDFKRNWERTLKWGTFTAQIGGGISVRVLM